MENQKPNIDEALLERVVADVTPLHKPTPDFKSSAPNRVPQRGPGRPRVSQAPRTVDLGYHAQLAEEKQRFIVDDSVVKIAEGRTDSVALLKAVRAEVAREAAAIHFQRLENEKRGQDTAQLSSRRIDALTKIAQIEHDIQKLSAQTIDLRSEKFQKVFALWVEIIRDVAIELLPPEQVDLFFNLLTTKMEGWEDRAEDAIR